MNIRMFYRALLSWPVFLACIIFTIGVYFHSIFLCKYHDEHDEHYERQINEAPSQNFDHKFPVHRVPDQTTINEDNEVFHSAGPELKTLPLKINMDSFKRRIIHLDLKGAAPKLEYLIKLLPYLKNVGVNGLLIEYEDTFPYDGVLQDIGDRNAYDRNELRGFLKLAVSSGFEIIPLIQTFGHMEFVLKLQNRSGMRENPKYPNALCPSKEESKKLIADMIDQVVDFHGEFNIKRLHVGCDEVFHIGECSKCAKKASNSRHGNFDVFLSHLNFVASYVRRKHRLTPISWDDEFIDIPKEVIVASGLADKLEIMVWDYTLDLHKRRNESVWIKYVDVFKGTIWGASCFKGATNSYTVMTNVSYHLENHRGWANVVAKYFAQRPLVGFVMTGWQRFDHFAILCELLPVGLPSLVTNLIYIQNPNLSDERVMAMAERKLLCDDQSGEFGIARNYSKCNFPGNSVYEVVSKFLKAYDIFKRNISDGNYFGGFLNDYNMKTSYTQPDYLVYLKKLIDVVLKDAETLEKDVRNEFSKIYPSEVATEWILTNIKPLRKRLNEILARVSKLEKVNYWPRRSEVEL